MKIGIDLDDVLSPSNEVLIKFHNDTYGTNYKIDALKTYVWELWSGTLEEGVKEIDIFTTTSGFKNLKPIKGAREVLEKLKKNNDLYIITGRSKNITGETKEWIEKYFPNIFSEIYFTNQFSNNGTSVPKKKICDDLGIDVFIEDNLKNSLECVSPNRKVYLFDYPWNQMDKLPERIQRVHSWKEIVDNI